MLMGIVKGMVVSTQKDEHLIGTKLLIVQAVDSQHKPLRDEEVAVDAVGAGVGEYVLLCQGSSARNVFADPKMPVDLVVVGIIDKQPGD
ncbi:MAG: EutN/CcmL family microcompartment protein [Treponema sp.]|jgi:ethanolamine utilization protein EutN|nr:EutN/CcmL family microcompartment protein [Treponema sp.]